MRRNNLGRVLIVVMRPVLQPSRTHLIHRSAKDALSTGWWNLIGVILVTLALRSCFISVFGRPRPGFGLAGARSGRSRVAEGQRAATCP